MQKNRLEAFSDGVLAIIITIMVLEMRVPHDGSWTALRPILPVFLSYLMSFVYIGIYWNNHHHMLHMAGRITGGVLWANLHLLFWLSLVPFVTGWMGENGFGTAPVAAYGFVLLMAAIAYFILQWTIVAVEGPDSRLARAIGRDVKGKLSVLLYLAAIGLALLERWLAVGIYALVALIWIVPDRRIEASFGSTAPDGRP
ncbi:MAG: DUF1211 domain-containing protein [Fimbriimonadaceae bacterium]|nr:DUF1211 domain-containing protein [Fimbriimonadaceae bacterium]